jgi:hypothetical protein
LHWLKATLKCQGAIGRKGQAWMSAGVREQGMYAEGIHRNLGAPVVSRTGGYHRTKANEVTWDERRGVGVPQYDR